MALKLKRLNKPYSKMTAQNGYHKSGESVYGFGDFRIKDTSFGWDIFDGEKQLNHPVESMPTLKRAKQFLSDYLEGKTKEFDSQGLGIFHIQTKK
jgi:hypothetical protein|tara:strand:+ start:210 stop:494 length:285 start_codon:yes stop_codon:yes gene_type:complete